MPDFFCFTAGRPGSIYHDINPRQCKTSVLIKFDSYPSIFLQSYVAWAMVAAISLGLLIGHSWQYFRNSSYEIFLIVHHILAVLFIAGAWIHTRGADTLMLTMLPQQYGCLTSWLG